MSKLSCPHCPDGHEEPSKQAWTVTIGNARDHDNQPTQLIVMKNGYQHVSESDAQWLWQVIRDAQLKREE